MVLDPKLQKQMQSIGEPWLFALNDKEPEELVESEQLYMLDHLRFKELLDRFVVLINFFFRFSELRRHLLRWGSF